MAIAKRYAKPRATVAVMSRDEGRVRGAAESLAEYGGEIQDLVGDVRDYERMEEITKTIAEKLGKMDIVVAAQVGNFYAPAIGMSD